MKRIVDVRSDTIMQPTQEMCEAMRNANEIGPGLLQISGR